MRFRVSPLLLGGLAALLTGAAARPVLAQATTPHAHDAPTTPAVRPDGALALELARVRAATAAFRVLDSAVAAGYAREVATCVDHPSDGAMGYHHVNPGLLDARLEVERPEMLVYTRTPDGAYTLHGVEYIVPYTAHARQAPPPTIMGQRLKRADGLGLWYLHVWTWTANPKGTFADWNPVVRC